MGVEIAIFKSFEWIWKNFGKDIIKSSADHLKESWQKFGFENAAKEYSEKMKELYGTMHIWNMPSPVPLENIFTTVNVLSQPSSSRRITKEKLEKMYLAEAHFGKILKKGKNGLNAVRENSRLFILGKPGSGKTTFLKFLTLQAVNGNLDRLPIFITLRDFAQTNLSLLDFIIKQFDICGFPDAQPFIKTILGKAQSFELTEQSFNSLREVKVPLDVLAKLQCIKYREYSNESKFLSELEEIVGTKKHISHIIRIVNPPKEGTFKITKGFLAEIEKRVPARIFTELNDLKNQEYKNAHSNFLC